MKTYIAILLGKCTHFVSKLLGLGAGGTWPGEIAVRLSPHLLSELASQIRKGIIVVAGTNGKTTTSLMISQILEAQGLKVVHNATGANLLNGVVSALIQKASWTGKINTDWGVFEADENSLPIVLSQLTPVIARIRPLAETKQSSEILKQVQDDKEKIAVLPRVARNNDSSEKRLIVVLLNIFRDQLDRYGEVDVIAEKWQNALEQLPENHTLILNADDPLISYLGKSIQKESSRHRSNNNMFYFGINDKKHFLKGKEHAVDSTFCLSCGARLLYEGIYYSHIGIWECTDCGEKRPKPDIDSWPSALSGLYNQYNTLAAVSTAKAIGIKDAQIRKALLDFKPAFGRQEEFEIDGKWIKLFLSKNPAGFNQSLRTIMELNANNVLIVLNDRIPDGRDISWIWDVDMEMISDSTSIIVSGDRAYDMGLRIKYAGKFQIPHSLPRRQAGKLQIKSKVQDPIVELDLKKAIKKGLSEMDKNQTLYVLATYSAMLEVRKILKGRRIL